MTYIADTIDWQAAKEAGIEGCICRASIALDTDPSYEQWIPQIAGAGLPHGAYHYLVAYESATTQARNFVDVRTPGALGDWLDVEETVLTWPMVRDFVVEYERLTGYEIGIYTRWSIWEGNIKHYDVEFAKRHPLWVANYGVSTPMIPRPWTDYTIWQYGVERKLDWYNYVIGQNASGVDHNIWGS